jgi:hypothetical protein
MGALKGRFFEKRPRRIVQEARSRHRPGTKRPENGENVAKNSALAARLPRDSLARFDRECGVRRC